MSPLTLCSWNSSMLICICVVNSFSMLYWFHYINIKYSWLMCIWVVFRFLLLWIMLLLTFLYMDARVYLRYLEMESLGLKIRTNSTLQIMTYCRLKWSYRFIAVHEQSSCLFFLTLSVFHFSNSGWYLLDLDAVLIFLSLMISKIEHFAYAYWLFGWSPIRGGCFGL